MARSTWSPAGVPDLTGKVAIITGANSGIGYHTAAALARSGAAVVLACRDVAKGAEAAGQIRAGAAKADLRVARLDLTDLSSVREFAETLAVPALDILVNNAGVMALPRRTTADGFELQFGTNHLGHYALTGLLLPTLLAAPRPRVVTVFSHVHRLGRIDFDDLQGVTRYRKWPAYFQSKLANVLFALELQRRAAAASSPLMSMGAHPGYAATNLQQAGPRMSGNRIGSAVMALGNTLLGQSAEAGSWPLVFAATADLVGGTLAGPGEWQGSRGRPVVETPSRRAGDEATARRLWEVSADLTGIDITFPAPAIPDSSTA